MSKMTLQEFCEQRRRMCDAHGCQECPINQPYSCMDCVSWAIYNPAVAERIVSEWAEAHPEPVYPTWNEWWVNTFSCAQRNYPPCKGHFVALPEGYCNTHTCMDCYNEPIPPDAAHKLRIKPKEVCSALGDAD